MITKHPVSAVLITFNCAATLEKVLQGISWCDEIVAVDSGSSDGTLDILKKFNCRVFNHEFEGYGPQKRYANSLAKNKWILSLDGDEVITEALKTEIEALFNKDEIPAEGYYIPITLVFMGKIFKYGAENKHPHLRLFNLEYGNFNDAAVHEIIEFTGITAKLNHQILHYSYRNTHHYFEKFNFFTSSFVKDALKKNRETNIAMILFRLPIDFIKNYFIRLNFLNGFPGFVWSVFSAFSSFVKLVKLYTVINKFE